MKYIVALQPAQNQEIFKIIDKTYENNFTETDYITTKSLSPELKFQDLKTNLKGHIENGNVDKINSVWNF